MEKNIKKIIREQIQNLVEDMTVDRGYGEYKETLYSDKVVFASPETKEGQLGYNVSVFDFKTSKTSNDWLAGEKEDVRAALIQKHPKSSITIDEPKLLAEAEYDSPLTKGVAATLQKYANRAGGPDRFKEKLKPQNIEAANRIIDNVLKLGRGARFTYDFVKTNLHSDIFDYVIESIIQKWMTADEKTKRNIEEALTAAYSPYSPRLKGILVSKIGSGFFNHAELPEALATAWVKLFGDEATERKTGDDSEKGNFSSFSGFIVTSMYHKMLDFFRKVAREKGREVSYDDPDTGDIGAFSDSPEEKYTTFNDPSATFGRFQKATEKVANWFDKNKSRKEAILFRSIVLDALTAEEILEAYAEETPNPLVDGAGKPLNMKTVQIAFNNMMLNKKVAKEISDKYAEIDKFFVGDSGENLIVPNRSGKGNDGKPRSWNYGKFVKQVHAPTSGREAAQQESLSTSIAECIIRDKIESFNKVLLENVMKRLQK